MSSEPRVMCVTKHRPAVLSPDHQLHHLRAGLDAESQASHLLHLNLHFHKIPVKVLAEVVQENGGHSGCTALGTAGSALASAEPGRAYSSICQWGLGCPPRELPTLIQHFCVNKPFPVHGSSL